MILNHMNLNLKDKVVIVTGGAKGIGKSIVVALAEEGAIPVIIGRNKSDNDSFKLELKRMNMISFTFEAELTNPIECKNAVKAVIKEFGKIDALVNNAGLNDGVGLESGDYDSFINSLHHSLIHYYLMAQYCLPSLKLSKGTILNISSKVAETGQGGTSGYAASNGARNALTREWAVELLKYDIRVNSIIVAECMTPQYEKWIQTLPNKDKSLQKITSRIPLENRMTKPEEIANMAVFLISDRSSHTTGQLLHVDGGYVHLDRSLNKE